MATYTTGDRSNDHPGQDPDDHEEEAMPDHDRRGAPDGSVILPIRQPAPDGRCPECGGWWCPESCSHFGDHDNYTDLGADRDLEARERQAEMEEREVLP
jgi:hypothetical protein